MNGKKRIGELLVEAHLVTPGQLEEALTLQREQGGKVVENLIALGHLDAHAFTTFLAKQRGIPSIDLSQYEVPQDLVKLIPKEMAQTKEVFPVDKMGSLLTVAMVCPLDAKAIGELQEQTGLRIKPMLCSPDDIRGAINRYYPMEKQKSSQYEGPKGMFGPAAGLGAPLKLSGTARLIRRISSLPALPATVEKVRAASIDLDISIQDVAAVIKRDPGIAAKILGVANSAAYGFPNRVDSLDLAISLMGLRETYSIVLAASVADMFQNSKVFDYTSFWKNSSRSAVAALVVGPACSKLRRAALFASGLLHQIGRVALVEIMPDAYARIKPHLLLEDLIADEEAQLGIGHPEAGYELASHWGLPADIVQAIRYYHRPADAESAHELVAITAVAHAMCEAQGADDLRVLERCQAALDMLKLDHARAQALLVDFFEKRDSIDLAA